MLLRRQDVKCSLRIVPLILENSTVEHAPESSDDEGSESDDRTSSPGKKISSSHHKRSEVRHESARSKEIGQHENVRSEVSGRNEDVWSEENEWPESVRRGCYRGR